VAPPRPLLRFDSIRELDTFDSVSDEEQFARGRYFQADCLATDALGHFVYVTGDLIAGVRQVTKVDITDRATMPAIGLLVRKPTATTCLVQIFGEILASGLTPPARYYVGADSKITDTPPLPGVGAEAVIQVVGAALDSGTFLVSPQLLPVVRKG